MLTDLEQTALKLNEDVLIIAGMLENNLTNSHIVPELLNLSIKVSKYLSEAVDSLDKKTYLHKLSQAREVSKECKHYLSLIKKTNSQFEKELTELVQSYLELNIKISRKVRTSARNHVNVSVRN